MKSNGNGRRICLVSEHFFTNKRLFGPRTAEELESADRVSPSVVLDRLSKASALRLCCDDRDTVLKSHLENLRSRGFHVLSGREPTSFRLEQPELHWIFVVFSAVTGNLTRYEILVINQSRLPH